MGRRGEPHAAARLSTFHRAADWRPPTPGAQWRRAPLAPTGVDNPIRATSLVRARLCGSTDSNFEQRIRFRR